MTKSYSPRNPSAFSAACRKLSTRMRTEKEIADYLKELEFTEETIADALTELKDCGYINDKKYAFEYFKYARRKGWAMQRIRHELATKGIGAGVIEEVKDEIEQALNDTAVADGADELGANGCLGEFAEELPELDDTPVAREVARKMARNQLADGKELDEKFMARLARRLAGLGYSSSIIYGVSKEIREYERDRDAEE